MTYLHRNLALMILAVWLIAVSVGCAAPPQLTTTPAPSAAVEQPTAAASPIGPTNHRALTVAVDVSPELLRSSDPSELGGNSAAYMAWYVYDPLVYVDDKGQLIAGLADKVEISADTSTYTFTLRTGVNFQDGTPFDANSVVSSWKRSNDLSLDEWKSANSVVAVDPNTVRITTTTPSDKFLQDTASHWAIVKEVDGTGSKKQLVGTGRYKLGPEDGPIALVANPDYWGPKDLPIEQLNLRMITASDRAQAIAEGNLVFGMTDFSATPINEANWNVKQQIQAQQILDGCPGCGGYTPTRPIPPPPPPHIEPMIIVGP